jgi:enamine deaminase RidA (YjgF/YER057c/UK114 family)
MAGRSPPVTQEHAMTIERIDPGARLSEGVAFGNLVFLAGHVSELADASVAEQTADILAQIDATLAKAGTDKSRLLSVQVWLTDIATWTEMNTAWDAWVDKANLPARATVESKLAAPRYKVEIAGVAAR